MNDFGFQWHLTDRCNQRCTHCYQSTYTGEAEWGLDSHKQVAKKIFEALLDCRVSVNLTGGEPFLLPWLGELVDYLHGFSNLAEVYIITNGTLGIGNHEVAGLKVSLESGDQEINDKIRGKGNFARVSTNIEKYIGSGYRVILMMTLARYNIHSIEETINWARNKGIQEFIFEHFVPIGLGEAMADQSLSSEHWPTATNTIIKAGQIDADPSDLLPYRAFWLDLAEKTLKGAECNLGNESMALMPDGTVYPCRRLPIPIGNALTGPFEEILARLAEYTPSTACSGCRAMERAVM